MSLVGKKAPIFEANAVINGNEIIDKFSLDQYLGKKYVIFFFYPMDFTFVCPTEIISFQNKLDEFKKRGCVVVGCSVDSEYSHLAWLNTERKQGGIKGVTYPLVSDHSKTISMNYGVLAGDFEYDQEKDELDFEGIPVAYRGLFLIDKQGVVRHQVVNDLPLGRSIDEALRVLDSLIHFEKHGESCPANWHQGEEAITDSNIGNLLDVL